MLTIGDKQYRNLQEQVLKNQEDIKYILEEEGVLNQFGIRVIGQFDTFGEAPQNSEAWKELTGNELEYGDAIAIGEEPPYVLYIWTRAFSGQANPFWFEIGQFPAPSKEPGPAPKVKVGTVTVSDKVTADVKATQVDDTVTFDFVAPRGSRWFVNPDEPYYGVDSQDWDCALDASTGDVYQIKGGTNTWQLIGNIRGPRGLQGIQGQKGDTGAQGPMGPVGPRGLQGEFINIIGQLDNTGQLPDPTSVGRQSAFLIPGDDGGNHIWLISGTDDLIWIDAGSFGGGAKIVAGSTQLTEVDVSYINTNQNVDYTTTDLVQTSNDITITLTDSFNNLGGESVEKNVNVTLPLKDSDDIIITNPESTTISFELSDVIRNDINNKIDKANSPSVVYATDASNNTTLLKYSTTSTGNALVQRQSNGCITVPSMPQNNTDAASKKYVDDQYDALDALIEANSDGIAACVKKSGDSMSGQLTTPNVKFTNLGGNNNPTVLAGFANNVYSNGLATIDIKQMILDYVYPVGSIYMTMDASLNTVAKMQAKFGGTWQAIADGTFLEAAGTATSLTTHNPGLPNIKGWWSRGTTSEGTVGYDTSDQRTSGCLYGATRADVNSYASLSMFGNSQNKYNGYVALHIDASKSSTIYSNSVTTVQPKSQDVWMFRRTA